ncbi:MAG: hypothetical protein ACYCST_21175, partial [Acidimicrobiales bacterium]
ISLFFNDEIISTKVGPKTFLYRSHRRFLHDQRVIDEIVNIVQRNKDKSICILSPIDKRKSEGFLNDIYSNVMKRTDVFFDRIKTISDIKGSRNITCSNAISTIHQSKGKEYDIVILVNICETSYTFTFPNSNDLCKLFVACSRSLDELHIFENKHYGANSLKWISDNKDLFTVPKLEWLDNYDRNINYYRDNDNSEQLMPVLEYIGMLTYHDKNKILELWSEPVLVDSENGCSIQTLDPMSLGILLEYLLAIKILKIKPTPEIARFLTCDEHDSLLHSKIPESFKRKVMTAFSKLKRADVLDFIDITKLKSEGRVVSELICKEYYTNFQIVYNKSKQITNEFTLKNIQLIWDVVKFNYFVNTLNLPDFEKINFEHDVYPFVKKYIDNASILNDLEIKEYQDIVRGNFPIPVKTYYAGLSGKIDFTAKESLIEIKCISGNNLTDAWIQVVIYNYLLGHQSNKEYYFDKLYVYNAYDGKLYERKLLIN